MDDDVGKNKSTTPSLTFPFALILNKRNHLLIPWADPGLL